MNDGELENIVSMMRSRKLTLAVAESLTGGALSARIVDIPGASDIFRGGVCTYATDSKAQILHVDASLLDDVGPVHSTVACQMAQGARQLFHADIALATTGIAGPDPHDGHPAGTVHIACVSENRTIERVFHFPHGRTAVRRSSVDMALHMLREILTMPSEFHLDAHRARILADD